MKLMSYWLAAVAVVVVAVSVQDAAACHNTKIELGAVMECMRQTGCTMCGLKLRTLVWWCRCFPDRTIGPKELFYLIYMQNNFPRRVTCEDDPIYPYLRDPIIVGDGRTQSMYAPPDADLPRGPWCPPNRPFPPNPHHQHHPHHPHDHHDTIHGTFQGKVKGRRIVDGKFRANLGQYPIDHHRHQGRWPQDSYNGQPSFPGSMPITGIMPAPGPGFMPPPETGFMSVPGPDFGPAPGTPSVGPPMLMWESQ